MVYLEEKLLDPIDLSIGSSGIEILSLIAIVNFSFFSRGVKHMKIVDELQDDG